MNNTDISMTLQEVDAQMAVYRTLFSVVRLITPDDLRMLTDAECPSPSADCFFCRKNGQICRNCVSVAAAKAGRVQSKLEFANGLIYQVMARPVRIDGKIYVIEMLRAPDEYFIDSFSGQLNIQKMLAESTAKLYTDVLTGAYSRRYYEECICDLQTDGMGVAIIDVDDFKLYNDFYGHNLGDAVLCALVETIHNTLRPEDRLIRYGGDEFVLVLPRMDEPSLAEFLGRLRKKISVADTPGSHGRLSVSFGGVVTGKETVGEALDRADRLLLLAKQKKDHIMTERDMQNAQTETEKPTVLIVDDSEINREILSAMLGGTFHILEAVDGDSCIAAMQANGTRISLCLLDILMPGKDGFDVLAYMNETHLIEELPVVIITGDDSTESIRRAYDLGVTDYINRPFDGKVVLRRALNTVKLYAKQRRLANLLTDRILEKEADFKTIISVLSHVVEFRNAESGPHVLRISRLTKILLEQLVRMTDCYALTPADIEVISTASMLHDIGKIGIDEAILNKPDSLTPEEYETVKTHTVIGAELLGKMKDYGDSPLVQVAAQICRWHHERWDGSGYPDGLRGEAIPIAAQIVALADVYDALISERAYKKAYPHEVAVQMILRGECGAFSPLLLDCLTKAEAKIREV